MRHRIANPSLCQSGSNGGSSTAASEASLTLNLGSVALAGAEVAEEGFGGVSPLPCLYSNNGTETFSETALNCVAGLVSLLSPYHKKQSENLRKNVARLMALAPSVCHIGFFTLTTPDNCSDHHEFRQRWRSFNSHYFSQSPHFGHWLATYERQRRGAWHLHVLVLLPYDIRTGVDFTQFALGRYSSAPPYLRAVWRELRIKCKAYGFGRHELLPIKSNADAMAQYIGKYISKHLGSRKDEDKGKRLIASSSGWTKNSIRFSWFNDNSILWRTNLAILARELGFKDFSDFSARFGSGWAYHLAPVIKDVGSYERYQVINGQITDRSTGEVLF